MTLTAEEIIEEIHDLVCFLEPFDSLLNSHLGSFFTEDLWNKHVPNDILPEINKLSSVINFIELYTKIISGNCPKKFAKDHPNLITFINKAVNVSIFRKEKYVKLLQKLESLLNKSSFKSSNIAMENFMPEKKLHEVKLAGKMTAFVSDVSRSSHVVDVGEGKGYLSCSLVLNYSFKVLGLDYSKEKTCGAIKRSENLAKIWNGENVTSKHTLFKKKLCNKTARQQFVLDHYKQVTTFVKPDTNTEALLQESFNEVVTGITLTGLHTCGNLATTCLKLFLNCRKIRGLVNVGCCYNLISEEFIKDEEDDADVLKEAEGDADVATEHGFPMSTFLRDKKYKLGQNARMLGCHSLERFHANSDFESSQNSLFYRAVFETIIRKINLPMVKGKLGKCCRKCDNFNNYISKALKKLEIDTQLSDLDELYECYAGKKPFLTAFYLLRICLAPVVESIILLDRILYLIENGVNNAYLVPLFDLKISPRGFGIIAWKDFEKS